LSYLIRYLDEIRTYKERLFGLYASAGAELGRNRITRAGGTTWGYRLVACDGYHGQGKITGTSIGEDEIRIFYDLCQLLQPKRTLVIGNGFGLSTLAIGLAYPTGEVISMDNWSEGRAGSAAKNISEQIVRDAGLADRIRIFTGTSPQDIPAALQTCRTRGEPMIDLAFIDGMHTNHAATADFQGLRPYVNQSSVVLWHNVHKTKQAFEAAGSHANDQTWDQCCVLRTYGPLGIMYKLEEHPQLHQYLMDSTLIWRDWLPYLRAMSQVEIQHAPASGLGHTLQHRVKKLLHRIKKG
jgi:predicted O-methyltransferase YrrM